VIAVLSLLSSIINEVLSLVMNKNLNRFVFHFLLRLSHSAFIIQNLYVNEKLRHKNTE